MATEMQNTGRPTCSRIGDWNVHGASRRKRKMLPANATNSKAGNGAKDVAKTLSSPAAVVSGVDDTISRCLSKASLPKAAKASETKQRNANVGAEGRGEGAELQSTTNDLRLVKYSYEKIKVLFLLCIISFEKEPFPAIHKDRDWDPRHPSGDTLY